MESLYSRVAISVMFFFFPLEARHAFSHTMTTQYGTIRSPDPGRRSPFPLPHPQPLSPVPIPIPVLHPHLHRGAFLTLRLLPRPSPSPRGSPSGAELWGRGSHRGSRRPQTPHCPRFAGAPRSLPVSRSSQQLSVPTPCSSILSTALHPSRIPALPVPVPIAVQIPPAGTCRRCRRCPLVATPRSAARIEETGVES